MTNRKMLSYMDNERLAFFMIVAVPYLFYLSNKEQKFNLENEYKWFEKWLDQPYDPSVMDLLPERMRKW